jgi:glycerol-3-phosphate O-acyltransferase
VLTTALAIAAGIAVYELVRWLVVRRFRGWMHQSAVRFVRRHHIRMEAARFIDRVWIREALAQDRLIEEKILEISRSTGEPHRLMRDRVDAYVEEIAPFFSLSAYYRFGASAAKRFLDFCFELVHEPGAFERQAAVVPPGAVRVYVINHRANMDPAILAYALLYHVPMSYAVGEWALVWPLHTLFRMFGSYFVRRGEKDPLYHAVLERFIQLIASHGAVTGFFPEGALSRDGRLRRPRTGLLDYLIGLRREQPDRPIVFLPIGLNYDRVFEDHILVREKDGPLPKPTTSERVRNLVGVIAWFPVLVAANLVKVATRSHRKFGNAAVVFGEPLSLDDWPGGSGIHALPDEARKVAVEALGEELLQRRIGKVIPALPVPVFCTALGRAASGDLGSLRREIIAILAELRARGAPIRFGRAFDPIQARRLQGNASLALLDEELVAAEEADVVIQLATTLLLRRNVVRRVVTPGGAGLETVPGGEGLIAYYANSIAHHFMSPA